MKLILKVFLVSVVVLAVLGGAGYWFIHTHSDKGASEISEAAKEIEQQKESEPVEEEKNGKEPEKLKDIGMDEVQLQIYLHQMTHQKIIADKKRGAVEMSAENIESMLTIVRANRDSYEHAEFYEKALTAWERGDFSNAVAVHNTIWDWHGGTVGRATDLMSQEQEAEYVKKHFK